MVKLRNLGRHLSLKRGKIFLLYFTALFKPKNTLSVVPSIGGTEANDNDNDSDNDNDITKYDVV